MAATPFASMHHTPPLNLFFDKLSAETRTTIYELSFTNDDANSEVHLIQAKPPTKSLLLVSRQSYDEANAIYKQAYRKYWTSTKFVCHQTFLQAGKGVPALNCLRMWADADIEHIGHFRIRTFIDATSFSESTLVDSRGGWRYSFGPDTVYAVRNGRLPFGMMVRSLEDMDKLLSACSMPTRKHVLKYALMGARFKYGTEIQHTAAQGAINSV